MIAVLSRIFGLSQIDRILDVVQDTFEAALTKWRFSGVPDNPSAWLMQVAKNKALTAFKRDGKTQSLSPAEYSSQFDSRFQDQFDILLSPEEIQDSQLRLLFACCHRDFSTKNQIIITLHVLCGFGTPEIANALLMNEEAVKKALTRSKTLLRKYDAFLQTSSNAQTDESIRTVHTILYLMFNEGYKTTRGKEAIDNDLCYEAIRLTQLLDINPRATSSETQALLALMFFNISRFPARLGASNEWLTLAEQDRSQWNSVFIEEGYHYLNKATQTESLSRFHLEAIIASLHCSAATFEATDWPKIAYLYKQLERIDPSPLVTLNRIIAESYLNASTSIRELNELALNAELKNNFLIFATMGDIYKRKGELKNALLLYEQALNLSTSSFDQKFLRRQIVQCQLNNN